MAADNLTGQYISSTFQRVLQLSDNSNNVLNGTGSVVNFLPVSTSYSYTASYAPTASYAAQASDVVVTVINQTGVQIDKGAVVRVSGSNNASDIPRISLADWTNDNLSANTLGLATTDIANGATGLVLTEGVFKGYDTSTPGWVSGQVLYLSSSGTITGSAPQAPLHGVRLGQVIRVQQNNGSIYVRIDNGYEIEELHDVLINTPSNGDLLMRSASVWTNSQILTGTYTFTGSQVTFNSQVGISGSLTLNNVAGDLRPYKVYTALVTQTSNSAPTATVLENTTGETIYWEYNSTGYYFLRLLTTNKVVFSATNTAIIHSPNSAYWLINALDSNAKWVFQTALYNDNTTLQDGLLNGFIEVRFYS